MIGNDRPSSLVWTRVIPNWSYFALGMWGAVLGPALPFLTELMGMDLSDGGVFFTAGSVGNLVAVLVAGWLVDLFDRQAIYLLSLISFAAGLFLLPEVPLLPVTILLLLLIGLGSGSLVVAANAVVSDLQPRRRVEALNFLYVFYAVGALLAPAAVSYSVAALGHVRYAFWAIAGSLVVVTLLLAARRLPRRGLGGAGARGPFGSLLASPSVWLLNLYVFVYLGSAVAFAGWIFTYVRWLPDASDGWAVAATSAFWLTLAVGRVAGARLSRRMSAEALLLVSAAGCTAAAAFLLGVQSALLIVLGTLVLGLFYGPMLPTSIGLGQSRHPEASGRIAGLISGAGAVGTMIIPWLEGKLMAWGGPSWCMLITLAGAALLVVLALGLLWERRRWDRRAPLHEGAIQWRQ